MKKTPSSAKKAGGAVQQTLSSFFSKTPATSSAVKNGPGSSPSAHARMEKGEQVKSPPTKTKPSSAPDTEAQKAQLSAQKEKKNESLDDVMEVIDDTAPQAAAKKRKTDAESSDEEPPVRRVRSRVRKSLREVSSEEEEEVVDAMESDDLSEKRNSSHTTPAKSEKVEKKSVSKLPATPLGKLPLQEKKQQNDTQKQTAKRVDPPSSKLTEKEQEKLHNKFVQKVSLFRERQLDRAADTGQDKARDENGFLVPCDLTYPRGAKLTPFETQVVEIKRKHPDTVLLVECGYKFRFLGRDAEIAAKVLNIFHHIDHNFLTCSIPVFRLQIHMRRLVEAGYKVGVVRQMETAALKAVSEGKSKAFQRELCEVYTKSTMLVEDVDVLGQHTHVTGGSGAGSNAAYMMCVCEDQSKAVEVDSPGESSSGVVLGMVCVDTASGDIVYDEFQDGAMRSELESRVSHLQPRELVLPEGLSGQSSKLLRRVVGQGTAGSSARIETIPTARFQLDNARKAIERFFEEQMQAEQAAADEEGAGQEVGCVGEGRIGGMGLDSILKLPPATLCCLAGLLSYLKEFKLDQILRLTSNFWRFTSPSHMMLDATVMSNLEILTNQNDGTEHGSLMWLLRNTRTAFGARLLRHWVTHPLVDKDRIVARHDAVEELMGDPVAVEPLANHLKGLPDLERALARVHYGKCAPNELVAVLKAFQKVSVLGRQAKASAGELHSGLLQSVVGAMPDVSARLEAFLEEVDQRAACATTSSGAAAPDRHNLLKGYRSRAEYPKIFELKDKVKRVEGDLEEHLVHCRRLLGMPDLQYKSVLQTEYLIEVPVAKLSKVPRTWDKINAVKAASRFHSPEVRELLAERARTREQLDAETAVAWQQFQQRVADCYGELRSVVQRLAVLDALLSLSAAATRGGWCRPQMGDEHELAIVQGRHPMVDQLLGSGYVPNDVELHHGAQSAMIITGPNMGGKSSYIRQNALMVIMAQIGSFVPADEVRMGVFDNVFTRMGAQDFIAKGQSTFLVELQEASDILRRATSRSLVIMDELGRGTSTHDGTAIAYASLKALVQDIKCFTLFVTHYQFICQMQDELPQKIRNHHMSFMEEGEDKIAFMYRLVSGSAQRSFGLNVALLAQLPQTVVDRAHCKSKELEDKVQKRLTLRAAKMVGEVCRWASGVGEADEVLGKLKDAAQHARRLIRTQELA